MDAKATELEGAIALPSSNIGMSSDLEGLTSSLASLSTSASGDGGDRIPVSSGSLPWRMVAASARALAFAHRGIASGSSGVVGERDPEWLRRAAEAMAKGAEFAKAFKGMLAACPRHVCVLESIEGGGGKVYQASAGCRMGDGYISS